MESGARSTIRATGPADRTLVSDAAAVGTPQPPGRNPHRSQHTSAAATTHATAPHAGHGSGASCTASLTLGQRHRDERAARVLEAHHRLGRGSVAEIDRVRPVPHGHRVLLERSSITTARTAPAGAVRKGRACRQSSQAARARCIDG